MSEQWAEVAGMIGLAVLGEMLFRGMIMGSYGL